MKLIRFGPKGSEKAGIVDEAGAWRDVSAVVPDWTGDTVNVEHFTKIKSRLLSDFPIVAANTRLGAPIGDVPKIIGCALTYGKHAAEAGLETPKEPMIMLTARTAINGPFDDVVMPRECTELDWEAELVVIMSKGGSYISEEDAMDHVAGYAVGNDVSERQFQLVRSTQWTKGKSADTLKPIGPWLVTKDEIEDPNNLDIAITVNGKTRQSSNTGDMVFTVAQLVSQISNFLTWEAGDVMFTGTPPGVGYGMKPQLYLNPGDVMEPTIAGLGAQRSVVVKIHD